MNTFTYGGVRYRIRRAGSRSYHSSSVSFTYHRPNRSAIEKAKANGGVNVGLFDYRPAVIELPTGQAIVSDGNHRFSLLKAIGGGSINCERWIAERIK